MADFCFRLRFDFCSVYGYVHAFLCHVVLSRSKYYYVRDSEIALNRNGLENMESVWLQDSYGVIKGWC
jgi:hypothetical protein